MRSISGIGIWTSHDFPCQNMAADPVEVVGWTKEMCRRSSSNVSIVSSSFRPVSTITGTRAVLGSDCIISHILTRPFTYLDCISCDPPPAQLVWQERKFGELVQGSENNDAPCPACPAGCESLAGYVAVQTHSPAGQAGQGSRLSILRHASLSNSFTCPTSGQGSNRQLIQSSYSATPSFSSSAACSAATSSLP